MNTNTLRLAVLVLALLTACAPPSPGGRVPSTWARDERIILDAITASADAWNRGDLKGHLAIYVDTVTFMTKSGPRPGVAAVEQQFTALYFRDGKPKQSLGFEQVRIRPLDDGAALATGRFKLTGGGEAEQSGVVYARLDSHGRWVARGARPLQLSGPPSCARRQEPSAFVAA